VPGYGYVISKRGRSVLFSGDTRPTDALWEQAVRARNLKAIFLELSFSDAQASLAKASGHFTPRLLAQDLSKAPPRVPIYLYHMKPPSLSRIRREIEAIGESRVKLLDSERSFRF
jgi:ribonuclease BN (tRNA processing enzyme)